MSGLKTIATRNSIHNITMTMASDAVIGAQAVAGAGYQKPSVECKKATHATVERLLVNDPDVAGLTISTTDDFLDLDSNDYVDQQYKLAVIGRAISKSSHLRELVINGHRHGKILFFKLLARNRSIEHLTLTTIIGADAVDIKSILAPFFEHNTNLRCIEIKNTKISCNASTFISALSKSGSSRLERLCLERTYFGGKRAGDADLINALIVMPGLHNLVDLDLGCDKGNPQNCMDLSSLLTNSECRVHTLNLSGNQFDIESIGNLIKGLAGNKSLKTLYTPRCKESTGWLIFMAFLSSPSCSIENIQMEDNLFINDQCAATLGTSLAVNEVMKTLQIQSRQITPIGWRDFFKFLKAPNTSMVELKFHYPDINDEVGIYMFSALASNTSLKRLTLFTFSHINSTGWVDCFRQLIGSKSALEELCMESDNMDDEGAAMLVDVISKHMSTLTSIFASSNYSVTAEGWRLFAAALRPSSSSKLTHMQIGNNNEDEDEDEDNFITDDVALDLFAALANNTCLQVLDIDQVTLSSSSLEALARVLCDKTTIANTWQSNHTLTKFNCGWWVEFPTELDSLLEMNKGKDKAEVARKKILLYSGLDEETVCHVFAPMATTVLPTAIEWIGRDRLGFSAMYYLVQNVPSLIERKTISVASDSAALESPHKRRKGG